jgi:SAM-dependent methyltransferase
VFAGTGPGIQTADGCSVELYRLLPYLGELDPIRPFLQDGASVLELGCGVGRLTRVLLGWQLRPTAVDFSDAMLAHVPSGVERICSSIQELHLECAFDAALLASCLINHPDETVRRSYLGCAARHLRPGGCLILERHDPEWLESVQDGSVGAAGPARLFVDRVHRIGSTVSMRLQYELEGQSWFQEFSARALREHEIERELAESGFTDASWHGPRRRWAIARR